MEILSKSKIRVVNHPMNAIEALVEVGNFLVECGSVTPNYLDEMVESFKTLGPYFVIAPSIALAHAKPSATVLQDDLVLILCKQPVEFKSKNDPVTLLFGLCAKEAHGHMDVLVKVAELLETEQLIKDLIACNSVDEVYDCLHQGKN